MVLPCISGTRRCALYRTIRLGSPYKPYSANDLEYGTRLAPQGTAEYNIRVKLDRQTITKSALRDHADDNYVPRHHRGTGLDGLAHHPRNRRTRSSSRRKSEAAKRRYPRCAPRTLTPSSCRITCANRLQETRSAAKGHTWPLTNEPLLGRQRLTRGESSWACARR
jgi:hypothetical protein